MGLNVFDSCSGGGRQWHVLRTWTSRSYITSELNNTRQPKAHAYQCSIDQETLMRILVAPTAITSSSVVLYLGVNSMVCLEVPSLVLITITSKPLTPTVMTGCKSWITPSTPWAFLQQSLLSWSRRLCGMLEVQAVIIPLNKSLKAIFHNWTPHLNRDLLSTRHFSMLRLPLIFTNPLLSSLSVTWSRPSCWTSLIFRSISMNTSSNNTSPRFGPSKINGLRLQKNLHYSLVAHIIPDT